MKHSLVFLCTALLLLTGCNQQAPADEPANLSERQVQILEAVGLPADYDELTPTQQHTVTRIEEMLCYMEQKYGGEFIYVKYVPAELMQSEQLICYARSTGAGENGQYLVTVKNKDGTLSDDYKDFSVVGLADNIIQEYLDELLGAGNYYYHSLPLACDLKKEDMDRLDFQWKIGLQISIEYELKAEHYDFARVGELARQYAAFLYEHHITGPQRFELYSFFPESSHKEWCFLNTPYKLDDPIDLGYYYFTALSTSFDKDGNVPYYVSAYIKEGQRRTDWETEYLTTEEFFSGETQPVLVPVHLKNVTYQDERLFENVRCDWDPENGFSYVFYEESPQSAVRFPKINRMLKAFGWEAHNKKKESFRWERDGHTVEFKIERLPYEHPDYNPHDLLYSYKLHLYLDGEEMPEDYIPLKPVDGRFNTTINPYYQFIQNDVAPKIPTDDFILELQFSAEAIEKLFGVHLNPDLEHWSGTLEPA